MTVKLSTGARNAQAQSGGFSGAFNKGVIRVYSGSQPASADAPLTGTLLGNITIASGALTQETRASGTVTITGGSGTVLTVTVGTFNIIPDDATIAYTTSPSVTAGLVADAINRNGIYEATVSGAVITIKPRPGAGASHNGYVVSSTGTCTATYANISGGVAAVNALTFAPVVAGVLSKPSATVWSFVGLAVGTAGWFRLYASDADAGGAVSAAPWPNRMDGSIAVSGADLNLSNIAISVGSPNTIDTFSVTVPAS
jgi:hypothetical protein